MHRFPIRTVLAAALLALVPALVAAQPQSSSQQKCINKMNKDGAKVSKTQGRETDTCMKSFFKGQLAGTAQDCLTGDLKQKVAKAHSKTTKTEAKLCPLLLQPDFAFTGAATVNAAATGEAVALVEDVFGDDFDLALDPVQEKCQRKVAKAYDKIVQEKFKVFLTCKKGALRLGTANVTDLANVCMGAIVADTKGKIAKRITKLTDTLIKTCPAPGPALDALFPGKCAGQLTHQDWASCIDVEVEGRICTTLTQMDGFSFDCDLFDDGIVCNDGDLNGDETDVDCGGMLCPACPVGAMCNTAADCLSGVCTGGLCQAPSCSDGLLNGSETDVDCGGGCPACAFGESCLVSGDCISGSCSGGSCSCGNMFFTFNVSSNNGGVFDSAEWPGGTQTQTTSDPACSCTINNPNDNIDLVCTLAAPFSINSFSGFSQCEGTGGEDADGCQPVSCPPLGVGSCCEGRPSCSAALNGSGSAQYFVQCLD